MEIVRLESSNAFSFSNIVATVGMFDGVHIGHKAILEALVLSAKSIGGIPTVITFEQHPRLVLNLDVESLKLLSSQEEKYKLLEAFGVQKVVVISFTKAFASLSASEFVQKYLLDALHIKGLILGYDNQFGNKSNNDFEHIYELAKGRFFITKVDAFIYNNITVSSTQVRNVLNEGNIKLANHMLGYEYNFEGTVVVGEKIGRTLGFPTANLALIEKLKMLPQKGVYAVRVKHKNNVYCGMLNIGTRPTFGINKPTIEVHLLNFSQDIYTQNVVVYMVDRIRDEKKFSSKEELTKQLISDKQMALAILKQ